ncbi:hypothetical protein N0V95_010019 [Ascochyta clinopodiicola]|nr:hypothetical protein N0V95_010019 [Ascochyta clinopodiicola]
MHSTTSRTTRGGAAEAVRDPTPLGSNKLGFLPLAEWDEYNSYEEDTPSRMRYSIEWKVAVNNRVVAKDTEQDLVLVPAAYWHMYLKPKVEKLSSRKVAHSRHVEYDDTSVVVSVNDRSERDLTKRFDSMDIDWSVVEKQLIRWGELFRAGKRLRVDLSFNYIDTSSQPSSTAGRGNKRGSSATQRMLADRTAHIDDEQETIGSPSVWQEVYALMRCPGPPCNLGPHCWRDPFGKRHYKLRTHHLKALVELVQQGQALKSHDDVPEGIREQLYAEEHQRRERQSATTSVSTPSLPPINITNVLPSQPHETSMTRVADGIATTVKQQQSRSLDLEIPGPRDAAVIAYSEWQQSNVVDEALKDEFRKACVATLEDGLDLEQVYEDQDPSFFIQRDVKRGVARRFVSDIDRWAKRCRLSCDA